MLTWLGIILFLTVLSGCILTPPIFSLILSIWPDFSYPFSRVYDRVLLVMLIFFLAVFRKKIKAGNLLTVFKQGSLIANLRLIIIGGGISFGFSLIAAFCLVNDGPLLIKVFRYEDLFWEIIQTFPAALLISFLEEGVFRVLIFSTILTRLGAVPAALISSLVYATVHFVTPDKAFQYPGFSPTIGFEYLVAVIERVLMPGVLYGVVGLFLIGLVLCLALRRSASIYLPIGLHGGWIFISKLTSEIFEFRDRQAIPSGLGARYFLVAQPLAWLSIFLVGLFIFFLFKSKSKATNDE